jgi:muramoyltetrapeptide carboxypeptidase LdcA involved in peptidoglycan recycling
MPGDVQAGLHDRGPQVTDGVDPGQVGAVDLVHGVAGARQCLQTDHPDQQRDQRRESQRGEDLDVHPEVGEGSTSGFVVRPGGNSTGSHGHFFRNASRVAPAIRSSTPRSAPAARITPIGPSPAEVSRIPPTSAEIGHQGYNIERTVVVLERMGFRVRRAPLLDVDRRRWWSAATPAEIAAELNGLLRDPEVRAIIASDGGQTVFGYLDLIDVDAIRADPKPILGYGDISLLHLVLHARTGLVGFHADMAVPGFGGHWRAAPATRQADLETLYRRLLTGTAGMIVGVPQDIAGLESPGASPTLAEIVLDVLGDRDIPVLGNVEVGHAGPNLPMPVGIRAGLDAQQRTLSLLEPAVQL